MKKSGLSSVRLLLVCLSLGTLVGCGAGPISVKGRVVDDNGTPISKAEIATDPATDVVVSNTRGYFVLRQRITELGETDQIQAGKYRLTLRKFGFQDLSFVIPIRKGKNVIKKNIVMQERTPEITDLAPEQMEEQRVEPDGASTPKIGN
jgi:hypothetical protein